MCVFVLNRWNGPNLIKTMLYTWTGMYMCVHVYVHVCVCSAYSAFIFTYSDVCPVGKSPHMCKADQTLFNSLGPSCKLPQLKITPHGIGSGQCSLVPSTIRSHTTSSQASSSRITLASRQSWSRPARILVSSTAT